MTHTITERLLNAGASGNRDIEAENLANAAPDLLKELERCLIYIDAVNRAAKNGSLRPKQLVKISHHKARKAVNKAKGLE